MKYYYFISIDPIGDDKDNPQHVFFTRDGKTFEQEHEWDMSEFERMRESAERHYRARMHSWGTSGHGSDNYEQAFKNAHFETSGFHQSRGEEWEERSVIDAPWVREWNFRDWFHKADGTNPYRIVTRLRGNFSPTPVDLPGTEDAIII